jgi:thioredoxin-related protein
MPIFVDCDWGKKNRDISSKYKVRGYPTVVFTDPDGNEVERLGRRDAESVAAQIEDVAKQHGGKK